MFYFTCDRHLTLVICDTQFKSYPSFYLLTEHTRQNKDRPKGSVIRLPERGTASGQQREGE